MFIYKKSLGQNLLLNNRVMEKIRASLSLEEKDTLLEIGAGPGNLTSFLAPSVSKLYAVEIDERFRENLIKVKEKFPNVEVIFGDFLKIPFKGDLLKVNKVTGNLPYNVGTPILERIAYETGINLCIFMFAFGTAKRFLAREGSKDYSAATVFTKSFFVVEKVLFVSRENFFPKPKVDSVVLKFSRIKDLDMDFLKGFNQFTKRMFSYRRKTIQNSLSRLISGGENAKELLKKLKVDPNLRVEMLNIDTLKKMYELLKEEHILIERIQ